MWPAIKLREVAQIVSGGTPKTNRKEFWGGDIKWITPKDLSGHPFRYIDNTKRCITKLGLKESSSKILPINSVLLSSRAPVGYCAINSVPMATNQGFKSIVPYKHINAEFIFWFLKNNHEYLQNISTGSTFKELSKKSVENLIIDLPPLPEQCEIAAVLSTLDDKIENNSKTAATLEEMARALYRSWFVDFDPVHARAEGRTPPHTDAATAALFPDRFGEDGLPEGWKIKNIGDELTILDSYRKPLSKTERLKKQGNIAYYGATSVMDYIDEAIFNDQLLLIGEDGSVCKEDGTPFIQYIWGKSWVNNHAHVLKGKNVSTEQLKCFFEHTNVSSFINGAVQAKLNQTNLKRIPYLRATPDIHTAFDINIFEWFCCFRTLTQQSQTLATLRDTLLPRLMSGELRVSVAKEMVEEASS